MARAGALISGSHVKIPRRTTRNHPTYATIAGTNKIKPEPTIRSESHKTTMKSDVPLPKNKPPNKRHTKRTATHIALCLITRTASGTERSSSGVGRSWLSVGVSGMGHDLTIRAGSRLWPPTCGIHHSRYCSRYFGCVSKYCVTRSTRFTASFKNATAAFKRSSGSAQLKRRKPLPAGPKHSPPRHATPL